MPDYDPLTISDEELKLLPPAERGAVYKARRAAGGGAPLPGAAAAPRPAGAAGAGGPPAAAAAPGRTTAGVTDGSAPSVVATAAPSAGAAGTGAAGTGAAGTGAAGTGAAGTGAAPKTAVAKEPEKAKEPPFVQRVLESIPDATWQWRHGYAEMKIPSDRLLTAARALHAAGFDYLSFITEVDWQDHLELLYHLFSYDFRSQPLGAILRCELPRDGMPAVASVTTVWPGAEFMEREAFEMMGIRFLGHPDLRRILLPDDFVGFPMRRDYETDFDYITVKQLVHESD